MIRIRSNAREVHRRVQRLVREQMPFAISVAINDTVKEIQKEQRARMQSVFEIRQKTFVERSVKIKPFATKRRLRATIAIDAPGGRSDIIARHEVAHEREPLDGRSLLVPIIRGQTAHGLPGGARRTGRGARPGVRELGLKELPVRSGDRRIYRGQKRTFMIREADGSGMILRRRRKGGHGTFAGVELLYLLVPRVDIQARLGFRATVRRVLDSDYFSRALRQALRRALATARR